MSLNQSHANGGVLIYAGECIILFCNEVELNFEGVSEAAFKGSKKGRLFLTTHRMIFTNKDTRDALQSFSFPFYTLSEVEIEQPVFGANFIKGKVKSQPSSNWTGNAKFKLHFKSGGAIEYGQAMLQAAKLACRNMPQQPPSYTPPPGPYYQAPPPAYTPPAGGYYGFQPPTHVFPQAPPANAVFMTDQPPPYPGLNTGYGYAPPAYSFNQPPPPQGATNVAASAPPAPAAGGPSEAKAWEATMSSYYDPNKPNYAFVPPSQQYGQAPPTYDEATKKQQ